jgi:hypothetical protein
MPHRQRGQLLVGLVGAGKLQRAGQASVVAHQSGRLLGAYHQTVSNCDRYR